MGNMGLVVRCRFCQENSIVSDHPECAIKFKDKLLREIFDHLSLKPGEPLPEELKTELNGNRWQWYLEYENRQKSEKERGDKIEILRRRIQTIIEESISEKMIEIGGLVSNSGLDLSPSVNFQISLKQRDKY